MKNLQRSAVCAALSAALLTPVAFAQSTQPMQPAIPSADPTTTGQPAAPTSPAEVRPPPPAAVGTMPPPPGTAAPMAPSPEGLPPPPKVMRSGSVEYMSGGAGEESRAVIDSMQGRFGLRNVFSGKGGEYVVPEKVTVQGASGPATEIANAGPILVMALPPGKYTIEAAVGGKVQRKTFTLSAGQPVKLNWNWPGA